MVSFTLESILSSKHWSESLPKGLNFLVVAGALLGGTACIRSSPSKDSTIQGVSAQSLGGHWAKKSIFTSEVRALGIRVKSSVTRLTLLHTTVAHGKIQVTEKICDITTKVPLGVTLTFPKVLINSLLDLRYSYELPDTNNRLFMPNATELVGVKLNNPDKDPLDGKKGAIFYDQDRDGHPGVTTVVGATIPGCGTINGRVYIAQRATWSEEGTWHSSERASGKIKFQLTQKVLGADNFIMGNLVPATTPVDEESFFQLIKLPEDKGHCDYVLSTEFDKYTH